MHADKEAKKKKETQSFIFNTFCVTTVRMWKKTMARELLPLLLSLVCLTGGMEETVEALSQHDPAPTELHRLSDTETQVTALLSGMDLAEVSSGVLKAESWLRSQVLVHYPTTRITTIVVGHSVLCNKEEAKRFDLVLPSLKNMFWCLKRWGLENEIKLSASFSSSCLNFGSASYREDMAESVIKPVLTFLHATNSTYSIDSHPKVSSSVSSHYESMRKVGFLGLPMINVIKFSTKVEEPTSRKLISDVDSKFVKPYPARPTPLPEISPIHSSIGYSSPAIVPKTPSPSAPSSSPPASFSPPSQVPPFTQPAASPPSPFSNLDPPHDPPFTEPAAPPLINSHPPQVSPSIEQVTPVFSHTTPPCGPPLPKAPKDSAGLWCVAKPSVPAETLQVGIDYACGAGGADCDEIKPYGSCFYPNSIIAHASYAFNSYWQKHKMQGGSCSFGGTAMIINADPSFMHCRFDLG